MYLNISVILLVFEFSCLQITNIYNVLVLRKYRVLALSYLFLFSWYVWCVCVPLSLSIYIYIIFEIELIEIDLFEIELFQLYLFTDRLFGMSDSIRISKLVVLKSLNEQSCLTAKVVHANLS